MQLEADVASLDDIAKEAMKTLFEDVELTFEVRWPTSVGQNEFTNKSMGCNDENTVLKFAQSL